MRNRLRALAGGSCSENSSRNNATAWGDALSQRRWVLAMKTWQVTAVIFAVLGGCHQATADEQIGRYRMVVIQSDQNRSSVLVLDSRDGQLWEWWENRAPGTAPKAGITYMGRVEAPPSPGKAQ